MSEPRAGRIPPGSPASTRRELTRRSSSTSTRCASRPWSSTRPATAFPAKNSSPAGPSRLRPASRSRRSWPETRPRIVAEFASRVRLLGDRLGPTRVQLISDRDEGMLQLILGSLDPDFPVAFDLEHESWEGIEPRLAAAGAVRVNDLEHEAPFRYVRFRDPPYSDEQIQEWAEKLRTVKEPVFAYFRHEDEPSAPDYAQRLRELLGQ